MSDGATSSRVPASIPPLLTLAGSPQPLDWPHVVRSLWLWLRRASEQRGWLPSRSTLQFIVQYFSSWPPSA